MNENMNQNNDRLPEPNQRPDTDINNERVTIDPVIVEPIDNTPVPPVVNQNGVNQEVTPIPPIQVTEGNNNTPVSPEPKKEPEYVGNVRPKGYIFAIFIFLLLAGFIFGLPYIDDYIATQKGKEQLDKLKEQEKPTPTTSPSGVATPDTTKQIVCTLPEVSLNNITTLTTQTFDYVKDTIKKVTIQNNQTYLSDDETYQSSKTKCEEDSLYYAGKTGYEMSCSIESLVIKTTQKFDLDTFSAITNTTTNETIESPYKKNSSLKTVTNQLQETGAVCK